MIILPQKALAITNSFLQGPAYNYSDPVGTVSNIIRTVIGLFFTVAVIYFFIYFILAGFNFLTSEGEKNTLETAKKQATYAVLGLSIIFCTFVVLKLIGIVFGLDDLKNFMFTIPTI